MAAKAPILARLEATAQPLHASSAEHARLRAEIFGADAAAADNSPDDTRPKSRMKDNARTQVVTPLPPVSFAAANGSRANETAGDNDADPLTPRSAKSFERSLELQNELAKGVRAGAAAAVAKVKLLKATLMIQRVSRGLADFMPLA